MHWSESRDAEPDASEPMAVFQIGGIVEGWTPPSEQRVSDRLNAGEAPNVRTRQVDGSPGPWLDLHPDDIVAVAPAPRVRSAERVSRRLHPVEVQAGPYHVRGTLHLPTGADPARYVASTSRWWLPLTACVVSAGEDQWEVDVMILNLDHAQRGRSPA